MPTCEQFRRAAFKLGEVSEHPHFDVVSFKVRKKVFATLNEKENRACVKLGEIDQSVFTTAGKGSVYPVPNKWGKHGWTNIDLPEIHKDLLTDILATAYDSVSSK